VLTKVGLHLLLVFVALVLAGGHQYLRHFTLRACRVLTESLRLLPWASSCRDSQPFSSLIDIDRLRALASLPLGVILIGVIAGVASEH
jgi:hypothetical protein